MSSWSSAPLIAPGPRPSDSPIARAVTAWSPVIMRTSIPAASAVVTAAFASERSGSMIPAMPTNDRSRTIDIGSAVIAASSSSSTSRAAKASTRSPSPPIRALAASIPGSASSIGAWSGLSGPPARVQRASTTSGPPLTSATTRSTPSRGSRWKVAMNL